MSRCDRQSLVWLPGSARGTTSKYSAPDDQRPSIVVNLRHGTVDECTLSEPEAALGLSRTEIASWRAVRMAATAMNHIAALLCSAGLATGVIGCASTDSAASAATDYTERDDATNNSNVGGTPEDTGLMLGATGTIRVLAEVNDGHYDTEDLDYDAFTFTATATAAGTLTLTGTDANAALKLFDVTLEDNDFAVGHATVGNPGTIQLVPGTYRLIVRAQNPQPITMSYPYTITVTAGG